MAVWQEYEKLIENALRELSFAVKVMKEPTFPATEPPRPRIFSFGFVPGRGGLSWPYVTGSGEVRWNTFRWPDETHVFETHVFFFNDGPSLRSGAKKIINACGCQPAKILRALRRIQAATAWCYARAEGRKRQAEEILRQQATAVEALKAEAAMQALK